MTNQMRNESMCWEYTLTSCLCSTKSLEPEAIKVSVVRYTKVSNDNLRALLPIESNNEKARNGFEHVKVCK